jgi:hypothetical protein
MAGPATKTVDSGAGASFWSTTLTSSHPSLRSETRTALGPGITLFRDDVSYPSADTCKV